MAREKHKRAKPRGESTEAGDWGGSPRSSEEGSVMELERRGRVRCRNDRTNWEQDDDERDDKQAVRV
jgi:hypothetical protein